MNAFTVIEQRGAILGVSSLGRGASRGADYDEARGPKGNRPGAPRDLARSRRVGLSRTVCVDCGAVKDQGYCKHAPGCWTSDDEGSTRRFVRETTGPLDNASPIMRIFERRGQAWMTLEGGASTAAEAGWK